MIHTIKSLYDNGEGSSIKSIAKHLGVSRNTVRKYLRMDEKAITDAQDDRSRVKRLDDCHDYVIHLLGKFPDISAIKVARKVRTQYPALEVSDRSVRRYVQHHRQTVAGNQQRHYEPVLDMVPGVQCQVDPGELRGVWINGVETTIHFVVFVLSFSRLMYVALSRKPIDTKRFIQMHDEAFRYFGGCPQECVYDQTKLVVLHEEYRELEINPRFHQYATAAGFDVKACRSYDPESKGKVEAGVKYVKGNALYGETFDNWSTLNSYMRDWLDNTANKRIHATTGEKPAERYDAHERPFMQSYRQPPMELLISDTAVTRKADKTGLISWKANKYSVPMAYQRVQVEVYESDGTLVIRDARSHEEVAQHSLHSGKGHIVKNTNHYRDSSQAITDYEQRICDKLGDDLGRRLCSCLQSAFPDHYRDQLAGFKGLLDRQESVNLTLLERLSERPALSVRQIREFLEGYERAPERALLPPTKNSPSSELIDKLTVYNIPPDNARRDSR